MAITVEVTLLSGRTIALTADADESLTTLKRRAETALRAGRGRHFGGSSSAVQERLKNVQSIQGRHVGFAAVLAVSWGA